MKDWKKRLRSLKKSDWAVIALLGILLLVIAMPTGRQDASAEREAAETGEEDGGSGAQPAGGERAAGELQGEAYADYLERRLEAVLGRMEGVGRTAVMVTLADAGEHVVEKDQNTSLTDTAEEDGAGGSRTASERSTQEETVYVETQGETYPYIQKEKLPAIAGVVVVAEGGGEPSVISDISEAVMALLPVEAHRIKVVKMSSKEE